MHHSLSQEAVKILKAAVASPDGQIIAGGHKSGFDLMVSGENLAESADAHTVALLKGGLSELSGQRFIQPLKPGGPIFEVTADGYRYGEDHTRAQTNFTTEIQWDLFISHAGEDKASFVRPLAEELCRHGLKVWFDEHTLTIGDSLRKRIDEGLAKSRFGVVILSHPPASG